MSVAAVGGFTDGEGVVLFPPPPHAVSPPITNNAITASTACVRFLRRPVTIPMTTPANTNSVVGLNGGGTELAFCVPETVTVMGTLVDVELRLTEAGFTVQLVPAGAPAHVSATEPMKPCDPSDIL